MIGMSDEAVQGKLDKLDLVTQQLENLAETLEQAIGKLVMINHMLEEEPEPEDEEPDEDEEPTDIRGA